MTTDGASGIVRPLRARLVRPDHATDSVFPMLDALPASERTSRSDPGGPPRALAADGYGDPTTGLYVYRLRRGEQLHVGIVADVLVEAFLDGRVRGHEEVQPERVEALVELFTSAEERSELVALLHRHGPVVEAALADALDREPDLHFEGPEGWEQTVWRLPDATSRAVLEELGSTVHYVADGHHRVAASLRVWELRGRPAEAGVMCVIYPIDGLSLMAFHRRIVGEVKGEDLLDLLAEQFDVTELTGPDEATGCFAVYVDGHWYDAAYTGQRRPGAAGTAVAILDEHVLRPLVGDDRSRIEVTSALSPLVDLARACDEDGGALFALRPPPLDELTEVADRGEVMPPKTTYFDPKPFAGIFLR
jgi:uncharacterized protein (DUF1015 family)